MRKVRKAFTLVEILIVVVILGILAAIVVPQFTGATQEAQAGNVLSQLDTLNNQIELYKARHNGTPPADLVAGGDESAWDTLIAEGYIKAPPSNPACPDAAGRDDVAAGAAAADTGWNVLADGTVEACYFDEAAGVVTPGTP